MQLNELNKKTLGSYIKKATDSAMDHSHDQGKFGERRQTDRSSISGKKAEKRAQGISRATDRLTKEDTEQLDELEKKSKETYHIINKSTGKRVGVATTKLGAKKAMDRHDMKYGSYNHIIKKVTEDTDMTVENILDAVIADNAVEFKTALDTVMQEKISAILDAKKQELAKTIVTGDLEEDIEELDEAKDHPALRSAADKLRKGYISSYTQAKKSGYSHAISHIADIGADGIKTLKKTAKGTASGAERRNAGVIVKHIDASRPEQPSHKWHGNKFYKKIPGDK